MRSQVKTTDLGPLPSPPSNATTSAAVLGRAFVVWLIFIVAESVLGTLRAVFLQPRVGGAAAQQIGFVTGSLALLLITWLMIRWIRAETNSVLIAIGVLWAALTFVFEMVLGRALGKSWDQLLADYNPLRGGLMWLALLLLLFAPLIAGRLRSLHRPD